MKYSSQTTAKSGYNTSAKHGCNVVQFDQEFDFLAQHLKEYNYESLPKAKAVYNFSNKLVHISWL